VKRSTVLCLLALCAAGCSFTEIPPPPSSVAVNECEGDADCQGGRCSGGICDASRTSIETLLVEVTPPATHPRMGGMIFYTPVEGHPSTIPIGPVGAVTVTISASVDDPTCSFEGPPPERGGLSPSEGTIPASVSFVPSERALLSVATPTYLTATGIGPGWEMTHQYRSTTNLPPGEYDLYIEPRLISGVDACHVPPLLIRRQNIPGGLDLAVGIPTPSTIELIVRGPAGDQSLSGWYLEMLDSVTGQPLSVRRVLPPPTLTETSSEYHPLPLVFSPAQVGAKEKLEIDQALEGREIIRLSPPDNLVRPSFLFERRGLSVTLGSEGPVIMDLSPPGGNASLGSAVPMNASIEGQTTALEGGMPVEAGLTLSATRIDGASNRASFVTNVQVDENGMFSAIVPPGTYLVRAAPPPFLGLAVAEKEWTIRATTELQAGKTIELPRAPTLKGEAILSGVGGPAFGATASAVVSPFSVRTTVLERAGLQDPAPPLLPRPAADVVSTEGRFEIATDPGIYDFFVRPEPRSNYSWLVKPSVAMPAEGSNLGKLKLPLPFVYRGEVVEVGTATRVPGALIRAYAYLTEKGEYTSVASDAVAVIPVAEARADEDGAFELLIPASLDVP
jgi:hypothetical protein